MEGRQHDQVEGHDPSRLRISDHDRHQVAEVLREAAGEGRIDLDELDERLEAAYSAKTYADLVPITVDLPHGAQTQVNTPVPRRPASVEPASTFTGSVAVLSDNKRRGVWLVPEKHSAFSMMGSVTLDLREAQFAGRDVTINAISIMGEVIIVVNAHTRVHVDGVSILGDFGERRDKVAADLSVDSPIVRVNGMALLGSVTVQRKPMPGEPRQRLLRGW